MEDQNKINQLKSRFGLAQIIFIALMAALNFVLDIVVSPGLKAVFTHVIAGIFLMVPINFLFLSLTKSMVRQFGTLTLYLTVFATMSIPTTMFGAPGVYKILVGLAIGLCLDIVFLPKKPVLFIAIGGIGGAIAWWFATYSVWQAFGFPFVKAFSLLLKTDPINLSGIVNLPITGFGVDFVIFTLLCGLMSAGPVLVAVVAGYGIFKQIEKTALYQRFNVSVR
jgi:hypothetical protein